MSVSQFRRYILIMLLFTSVASAADTGFWPQFHGPTMDNRVSDRGLPLSWSESSNVVWKTEVAGRAWSSPVVWASQVWLTNSTKDGLRMSVVCLDLETGRVIHDILLRENENPAEIGSVNSYASPTPAIEEGRLYAHFGSYGTFCLDTSSGKTLWARQDLKCDHEVGPGSSVVLRGDRLFLSFDGTDVRFLVALDTRTGRTVWRIDRNISYSVSGSMRKAFSTPVFGGDNGELLISAGAGAAMAFTAATGKECWRARYGNGFSTSSRVRVFRDLVFLNSGYSRPRLIAVRLGGQGDVTDSHVVWETKKDVPIRASPVLVNDLLFMVSDQGVVSCLEPATGELIWRERLGGGRHSASPLAVGNRIYLMDEKGKSTVIEGRREFRKVAEGQLDEGFMASPAVVGESFVLRTRTHVYRIASARSQRNGG